MEWRLITAGTAELQLGKQGEGWQFDVHIESAGLVTRLYKVLDTYKLIASPQFCGTQVILDAQEGKRHMLTHINFNDGRHKVDYEERDLLKNSTEKKQLDVPPCTHDILGALSTLRAKAPEPGQTVFIPVTDGKKVVNAKLEAQAKETVNVAGKNYQTVRYEAFLFDNVLYKRRGRLFIWLSDDGDRVPVQMRIQLGFPIGTISLLLDKQQKL